MSQKAKYTLLYRKWGVGEAPDGDEVQFFVEAHVYENHDAPRVGIIRWHVETRWDERQLDAATFATIDRSNGYCADIVEHAVSLYHALEEQYPPTRRVEEGQDEPHH